MLCHATEHLSVRCKSNNGRDEIRHQSFLTKKQARSDNTSDLLFFMEPVTGIEPATH